MGLYVCRNTDFLEEIRFTFPVWKRCEMQFGLQLRSAQDGETKYWRLYSFLVKGYKFTTLLNWVLRNDDKEN